MIFRYGTYYNYHAYEYPTLEEDYDQEETNPATRETQDSQCRDTGQHSTQLRQILLSRL